MSLMALGAGTVAEAIAHLTNPPFLHFARNYN